MVARDLRQRSATRASGSHTDELSRMLKHLPRNRASLEYLPRMFHGDSASNLPPAPLVAVAGWLVPGAGYWLIGQRSRGLVAGITIIVLFILGLLIAGVRVIEVPGYGQHGYRIQTIGRRTTSGAVVEYNQFDPSNATEEANPARDPRDVPLGWALQRRFLSEIANKPWFIGQVLAGPLCLGSAALSVEAAQASIDRAHAPLEAVGTLYTAVAGMLNLLVIIDSSSRASHRSTALPTETALEGK
jgi:hypothetical protein